MADFYRILSIDGGGIRGIIPAGILIALEEKLQQGAGNEDARIADYFDLIAGTSTGGILACVYLCPSPDQPARPRFDASDALGLYFERGDEIFDIPLWHKIRSGAGLFDERYPAAGLEEALDDYLGELKLSALLKPCLITAYDIRRRRAHFFRQHRAERDRTGTSSFATWLAQRRRRQRTSSVLASSPTQTSSIRSWMAECSRTTRRSAPMPRPESTRTSGRLTC